MTQRFFEQAALYCKGHSAAFEMEEFVLMQLGYPLVTLIFYCLVALYGIQTTDLTRWVVGNSFLLCTNACIFSLGNIFVGERYWGRLRSIIVSPCAKLPLILANGVFPTLFAMCASVFGFIIGSFIFGVDFSRINIWLTILTVLCAMISASCFGLFLSMFGLMTESMHLILNVISYMLMIFTGAQFPVSQLPLAGRIISQMLPLTKSISAMNMLLENNTSSLWSLLVGEVITGVIYALLAWGVFETAERIARKSGRFDMF